MTHTGTHWSRVVLPALLIVTWLVGASLGGPFFGRIDEVSSNEASYYLPDSAEATEVQAALPAFTGSEAIPAVLVFTTDSGSPLTSAQVGGIEDAVASTRGLPEVVGGVSPALVSEDGVAAQAFVPLDPEADTAEAVDALGTEVTSALPAGVDVHVTGPAGFTADLIDAFAGIDGLLLGVALGAVLVILLLVYRSLVLPFAVLATSMFALCVALMSVWWLAYEGILVLSGQIQGILFILVIGAATDYALLYVSRYREALRHTRDRHAATRSALRGSVEPILASGGTVVAGLLCLLLSDLKSNSALGPVAAIGIAFSMLAALTFLPAVLLAFGRVSFWPRIPEPETEAGTGSATAVASGDTDVLAVRGIWRRVATLVEKRARTVWVLSTLVLLLGAVGLTQLEANGVAQSELVLGRSEARDGQELLAEHFPGGSGSPVYVLVDESDVDEGIKVLDAEPGVDSTVITANDSPSGTLPLGGSGEIVPVTGPDGTPVTEPTTIDGRVLLQSTLTDPADSLAAEDTVRDLRADLATASADALVGGVTATAVDTNDAAIHDRNLIIPSVLAVIWLILVALLRSVLAPVLLVATTVLSFGTALGVSAFVFTDVLEFPGADPAVPLYGFVFLVALGIDYNIFLMTRVREESLLRGTRTGVLRGLMITGGVITSAGVVLAATFAALAVIPILFLAQLAFIVSFGVLLDTLLVRSLLVPALVHDIGPRVWWPGRLPSDRSGSGATPPRRQPGRSGTADPTSARVREPVHLLAERH